MKKNLIIYVLFSSLFVGNTFAGDISCDNLSCTTNNITTKSVTNLLKTSKIWVSEIIDPPNDYLGIKIPFQGVSRDLKVYTDISKRDPNSIYSSTGTKKLSINSDLSSTIQNINSGSVVIIASILSNLSLTSNGRDGVNGVSSSELCAQWKNTNQGAGISKCTQADVTAAYNSFSCPAGYTLSWTDAVNVSRYVKVRKCYSGQNYTYLDKNANCPPGATDLGLVKDPNGNTEDVLCQFNGNCDLTVEKKEYPLSLATFAPTAGTTAILAGSSHAFVYSYDNLTYSNYNGAYGIGGKADLAQYMPNPAIVPKYCYLKYDLGGAPSPDYFLNPYLSFFKINWQPFIEKPTASDGLPGVLKNGTTTVIKGLDSSVRYWLGNDTIQN